ncbi:defensin-like protein 183 [Senna tora]|uniref:Defensin-like protein n=1 Tax=Senna tora TaxID=362788 RepID=A0A835CGJ9_9FABA|nr:defensin-like protein 183 [Senna tora]
MNMMVEVVEGGACTQALGACGAAGDCDERCRIKYQNGQGSCSLGLCTCYYNCGPSLGPTEIKSKSGLGPFGIERVEGNACSEAMGQCGPAGDCDKRCKAQYPGGEGSCDLNLCTCYYSCGPPPSPPGPERKCTGSAGFCTAQCGSECCNSECARKYNEVGMNMIAEVVEGDSCTKAFGECGPTGDCDERCRIQYQNGQGSCTLGLCICYYNCGPSLVPTEIKTNGKDGLGPGSPRRLL